MKNKIFVVLAVSIFLAATVYPVTMGSNSKKEEKNCSNSEILVWMQDPDLTGMGIDVRCDRSDEIERLLANDFECTMTGLLTRIIIFGSWKNDEKGSIDTIHLSIHDNIPANVNPEGYSMPGKELWTGEFSDFNEDRYSKGELQWWWDPYLDILDFENHREVWSYEVNIPDAVAFTQTGSPSKSKIYWIDVYVEVSDGEFGWKTAYPPEMDDATFNISSYPGWYELRYPPEHPQHPESLDMSMGVFGKSLPTPYIVDIDPYTGLRFGDLLAIVTNSGEYIIPSEMIITIKADATMVMMGEESIYETEEPMNIGDQMEMKSNFILGFGTATFTFTAKIENLVIAEETKEGFIFGPFIFIKK